MSDFSRELYQALVDYIAVVEQAGLTPLSAATYRLHAIQFVRWIAGDFHPGEHLHTPNGNSLERLGDLMRNGDNQG